MDAAAARFPEVVWASALLRGLEPRARAEIEAAGRLRACRAGEIVYRAGDAADAVLVVAHGSFSLAAVRRGEAAPSVIRRARAGETFGEEPTVRAFAERAMEARCDEDGAIAELPMVVLRRALGRSASPEAAARLERALRRAATLDLLRATSFTQGLGERDLELLLDAARHVHVDRGAHVYREGDPPDAAYFVADGLVQVQTEDEQAPRVEAYLARGDLFGEGELEGREPRVTGVVAAGPAWLVAVPRDPFLLVARRNGAAGAQTTAHVFKDLYRMRVARSLLVIDQDACFRCGHCAWSCASVHDDGISRLVRRGDTMAVVREDAALARTPLLVPNSCQHCKNPSCMIGCPTGAIGRDARGEVFIREDLCTGCGSCAKACPWENIAMAPRSARGASPYPDVAVKCDLCTGLPSGPACVASCPTDAIFRIDPNEALVELGGGSPLPRRSPAWPALVGASLAAIGLGLVRAPRLASGVVVGALLVLLALYAACKRLLRLPRARALYVAHVALGALAAGVTLAHVGPPPTVRIGSDAGGALALVTLFALLTGAYGALVHALVPSRLARLERSVVLPEELRARRAEVGAKVFATLSGRGEGTKVRYAAVLAPYRSARLGAARLALSGRTVKAEVARLLEQARGGAAAAPRSSAASTQAKEALDGLDALTALAVEERALGAQRLLLALLRGWLAPHVALAAAAVVLLVVHVIAVVVKR